MALPSGKISITPNLKGSFTYTLMCIGETPSDTMTVHATIRVAAAPPPPSGGASGGGKGGGGGGGFDGLAVALLALVKVVQTYSWPAVVPSEAALGSKTSLHPQLSTTKHDRLPQNSRTHSTALSVRTGDPFGAMSVDFSELSTTKYSATIDIWKSSASLI